MRTRNEASNTAAATAQTNKRHRIAMKQLVLIMLVYVTSFLPMTVSITSISTALWLRHLYYLNHISNFFIYLSVNKEFRKEAKNVVNVIIEKVRRTPRTVFALRWR